MNRALHPVLGDLLLLQFTLEAQSSRLDLRVFLWGLVKGFCWSLVGSVL